MSKKVKIALAVGTAVVLAGAGGAYAFKAMQYQDKFLPNTFLNEDNVGEMTVAEANENLKKMGEKGSVSVIRKDGSKEEILLSSIGFTTEYAEDIQKVKEKQSGFGWIANAFGEERHTVELKTSYDESRLKEQVHNLKCISGDGIQDPKDAHIEKTDNGYQIVDAIDGNRLDEAKVKTALESALKSGESEVTLESEQCYQTAKVRGDDPKLKQQLENMERYAAIEIQINLTGAKETLKFDTFADWVTPDGDKFKVNAEEVKNYTAGLAVTYDTYGSTRKFKTTGGKTIDVGGNGDVADTYGWQMDVGETAKTITKALQGGKSASVDAVWTIPARDRDKPNGDIGDTYVEIDLTAQHMYYYRNGELYTDTDIVSGYPNEERKTPTGIFRVWHKETDTRLQGQLESNGQTWDAPVKYWMPITWTGVGIHDASWVSVFGPGQNESHGSHGCINTPEKIVAKMFEVMEYDTPVIIYYS